MLAYVGAISAPPLYAQQFQASISGRVADPTGAVIPGASIKAVNNATGVAYSATSNKRGAYSVLYLLPGSYTVTVRAPGFQKIVYKKIVLDTAQKLGLNVTLKPGQVTQTVQVTSKGVELNTVSASTGGVMDRERVENMPSPALNSWDDVIFTQGISFPGTNLFKMTLRNNGNHYVAAGAPKNENAYYLNGAPISTQGNWYFSPNHAAINQVQAFAEPYDAEYGRTGGGVFSEDLKSGTNAYHGSIYDYYGDRIFNANSWINDLSGISKPVYIRNTYGAESGGPIIKRKMFYFFSYEGFKWNQPQPSKDTVPTTAEHNGDFSGTPYKIYDPLSTYCAKTNSSGGCKKYSRKEFPNDTIPPSQISPIGKAMMNMYPAPNHPGLVNNYVVTAPQNNGYQQWIGRIDENFSGNTRMYALYAHEHTTNLRHGNGLSNAAWNGKTVPDTNYLAIVGFTHIFSASTSMDLKASYWHDAMVKIQGNAIADNFLASKLGFNMPAVGSTPHQNIAPALNIGGATPLFANTENGTMNADADFSGGVTELIGKHALHYGATFEDIQTAPTGVLGQPNGSFKYTTLFSQENPLKKNRHSGNSFADLLLGYPSSGGVSWNEPTFITVHYYGLYVQDTYQALRNLTLTGGLRWDVNLSPRDRHNQINDGFCLTCTNPYTTQVNYAVDPGLQDPLQGGLRFAGVNGAPSAPYTVQWNDWQPRIGFSWAAFPNTVVRGGYGIFYSWEPLGVNDIGFSQSTPFVPSLNGNLTPDNYLNSGTPYPGGAVAPAGSTGGLKTNAGNSISYDDPQRGIPVTQHWSFGFQQRLPWSLLLDVEYLGTNVHHLPVNTSLGVVSTTLQQACNQDTSVCNTNVSNPFYGVLPTKTALGASKSIPKWKLERAYPLFNGVTEDSTPIGSSHYNGLALRLDRRVRSLNFIFAYSYSNWIDRDQYLDNGSFRDAHLTTALDPADRRNTLEFNMVYPLPGRRAKGLLGALTNRWLFDSTVRWGTGEPLALPDATFSCASLAPLGGQTRAHWFNNNENCWTPLGTWERRTLPLRIGFLRDPGFATWNAALSRQFSLSHGVYAHFRCLVQNVPNHPTFGGPDTNINRSPSYSPSTSWTGLGTLPTSQIRTQRHMDLALRISF